MYKIKDYTWKCTSCKTTKKSNGVVTYPEGWAHVIFTIYGMEHRDEKGLFCSKKCMEEFVINKIKI